MRKQCKAEEKEGSQGLKPLNFLSTCFSQKKLGLEGRGVACFIFEKDMKPLHA